MRAPTITLRSSFYVALLPFAVWCPPTHTMRSSTIESATGMLRRASMTLLNSDDVGSARRELAGLAAGAPERPGIFLRLAFHDAMTYDAATRTGGANASIR